MVDGPTTRAADVFMFRGLGHTCIVTRNIWRTYGVEYRYKHARVVSRIIGWRLKLASRWTSVGEGGNTTLYMCGVCCYLMSYLKP